MVLEKRESRGSDKITQKAIFLHCGKERQIK